MRPPFVPPPPFAFCNYGGLRALHSSTPSLYHRRRWRRGTSMLLARATVNARDFAFRPFLHLLPSFLLSLRTRRPSDHSHYPAALMSRPYRSIIATAKMRRARFFARALARAIISRDAASATTMVEIRRANLSAKFQDRGAVRLKDPSLLRYALRSQIDDGDRESRRVGAR